MPRIADVPRRSSPICSFRGGRGKATNATAAIDAKQTVPTVEKVIKTNVFTWLSAQSSAYEEKTDRKTGANDVQGYSI